ncbi:hypothetical protein P7H21_00075 [Paenibacillus larvae]|nr:hypothetical protein [Paenibacillus larvae]
MVAQRCIRHNRNKYWVMVVFCDSASSPIIGDFNYSHFNYNLNALYDRDKDAKQELNSLWSQRGLITKSN